MENKNHWYDGAFYDKLIAPNQDRMFGKIKEIIEPNSSILDIGCGTGRLEFYISDKCKLIKGIDLSKRNIDRAELNLKVTPHDNITFEHIGLDEFAVNNKTKFEYAILTYVIHEVQEEKRAALLKNISNIADKIIIGDYLVPRPGGFWSALNEVVEFAAGADHYKNFKSFASKNGINGLAKESGLKIIKEIKNHPSTSHIAVLSK